MHLPCSARMSANAAQSMTDGLEQGKKPVGRNDDDASNVLTFKPAMVFGLFALTLEVIGIMSVSVTAAIWYLDRASSTNRLAFIGYFLTILLPFLAILLLVNLVIYKEFRAYAYRRLLENGILMFSDANSFAQKVAGLVGSILVSHTVLVGLAAVLEYQRGGMSIFEAIAKWGAVGACGALLTLLAWELASTNIVLLDSVNVKEMWDDKSVVEFAKVLNKAIPMDERAIGAFVSYITLLSGEVKAREKANIKNPYRVWKKPLDHADVPKFDFDTLIDASKGRTPDDLVEELIGVLEATALTNERATRLMITEIVKPRAQGVAFNSEWEQACMISVDPRDNKFYQHIRLVKHWARAAVLLCFAASSAWYASEAST